MDLLALDDPVFVIELTPTALQRCRRELEGQEEDAPDSPHTLPAPPSRPIRAVALVLEDDGDPLLLSVAPTRDVAALDAAARLVRAAAVTGRGLAQLATGPQGDAQLRELFFSRRLPAFIYEGIPKELAGRLPPRIRTIFAGPRRGASG